MAQTYYIMLPDDGPNELEYDANVLGQESFGKFYAENGMKSLESIVENHAELLQSTTIVTDTGIEFTTILIRDFGIGIATQEHERIFNDFYRGNNVRDIPGTGLGMSITREFLKLNNCTIEVESELGLGSTFSVKLPK